MKTGFLCIVTLFFLSLGALHGQSFIKPCNHTPGYVPTASGVSAANSRSDSIDILHIFIRLDITDFVSKVIGGSATLTFTPRLSGINYISVDLLKMQIDSVTLNGNAVTYTYNDTLLTGFFPGSSNINDTLELTVYYHGVPVIDPSGWGGFYFQGGYAFNLGVGFQDDPHNYGRTWFPCFDNFVERSTYEFIIRTKAPNKAHCNGLLLGETLIAPDTIVRHWKLNQEIPSYLACVAAANYQTLSGTYQGIAGPIPVELAAVAGDTSNVKSSFVNLHPAIASFENAYGPYVWDKVGYSMVAFGSGAMEHATNITYPRTSANGTLNSEGLMAHELAHHWWGNLVTCETAEDMWINEGWASFSEYIFMESIYGRNSYINAVKTDLNEMLRYLHHRENGFRAVSGVPHDYTYSSHVYKKGATVAHTLRGYLGDSLFFHGITTFLDNNKFMHVNSTDMMNELGMITGKDLTHFFNDWVFNPGFPEFSIDSVTIVPASGNFNATVHVKQRLKGAPDYFTNVPIEIKFMDENFVTHIDTMTISGQFTSKTFSLPFHPVLYALDPENLISQAVSSEDVMIKNTGTFNLPLGHITLIPSQVQDSVFIRSEHHWVGPDSQGIPVSAGITVSPDRYWRIEGVLKPGFHTGARFQFDGRTSSSGGYLDHNLPIVIEDSIILLYRRKPGENWKEYPHYSINTQGSATNKTGSAELDTLLPGEYTFAYGSRQFLSIPPKQENIKGELKIYPNPAGNTLYFDFENPRSERYTVRMFDNRGRCVAVEEGNGTSHMMNLKYLRSGIYTAELVMPGIRHTGTVILQ